ncbi:DUF637 domain-containing protein [Halomonas denitrificans]|nr:DUF637 domain-containing protein [Halomonas denitrificans]
MASNAAVSTINQQGDLGEAWGDVTSSDALRGYAVAAATAGLTSGLYDGWTGTQTGLTTGLPNSGTVTGAPLGTWQGAGQFGANQLLQNTTSALLDRALGGDAALGDAFQASLANTFAAAGFNAIGNTSLENGSLNKAALHAVMGGLAAEAAGGDFTTGALAAGANELLVDKLAGEYSDLDQADKGRLLVMNSQIIGVIAAEIASNDDSELQIGAQVAGSATQYNYLSHWQKEQRSQELEACQSLSCKAERNDYWTEVDQLQDSAYHSGMVSGVPEALYESADDLLALFDGDTYAAMAALLQEDNIIVTLIESAAQDYAERLETYQREYERAGADGAYNAGV